MGKALFGIALCLAGMAGGTTLMGEEPDPMPKGFGEQSTVKGPGIQEKEQKTHRALVELFASEG